MKNIKHKKEEMAERMPKALKRAKGGKSDIERLMSKGHSKERAHAIMKEIGGLHEKNQARGRQHYGLSY